MQIRSMSLDQNMVEFNGGKVLINGETVAIYENAPAFSNYGALTQKKQSLKEITAEYLKQKAEYLSNPEDIDCYLSYSQLAKQKNDLEEEIDKNEKDILTQLQQVYTFAEKGNLSQKQILAYRLVENSSLISSKF